MCRPGWPRVRVFDTGQGRKTDATDAHSIAAVAVRTRGLRELVLEDLDLEVMRLLVDRREEVAHLRVQIVNRLHRLLTELIPGGARKRDLSALQARQILAGVRPLMTRDPAGATRRRLAMDLVGELEAVDAKLKTLKAELRIAVRAYGSRLMDLYGIGPAGAARLLVDVATITRFPVQGALRVLERDRTVGRLVRGADPSPALPRREPADQPRPAHHGDRPDPQRHPRPRLLPAAAGPRQDADGSVALLETPPVRRRLPADAHRPTPRHHPAAASGSGRTHGGAPDSSADDLATPTAASSDKSLPGPATNHATPAPETDDPEDGEDEDGDQLADQLMVETIDLPAEALVRRASAGAGHGLPLNSPARARRGSAVQGGPKGRHAVTRSALDGGGASPYQRGAGDPRAADSKNTGGEAATAQDLPSGLRTRPPTTH